MTWIVSLLLAGVMFTSDGNLPIEKNHKYVDSTAPKALKVDETERFQQTYPLNSNGRVRVSNINGSITVEAWDRNEVRVEAVKTADSRETLSDVEIKVDSRPDYLNIETDYQNWKSRSGEGWRENRRLKVDYRLTVPRTAVLNEIEAVNGSVTVSDMSNYTKVSAVNGQVKAMNLSGTAILSTVNGQTEAEFTTVQPTSKISLSTVNGQVTLLVPSDINATVKADTLNGNINNAFGLPVRKGQYIGRNLHGRIGSGGADIKLNSVNGGLTINRRNDGRNPNPAVNLLPAGDVSEAEGENRPPRTPRPPRPPKTAVVDVEKMNAEINEQVRKEMEKSLNESVKEAMKSSKEALKAANLKEIIRDVESSIEFLPEIEIDFEKDISADIKADKIRDSEFFATKIQRKSEKAAVKGVPKITVDAKNCSVNVRAWDKPEVQYFYTKISKSDNQTPVTFKTNQSASEVKITVSNDESSTFDAPARGRLEVFVPKKSNLRILTNREIRLEGVSGEIALEGREGAIDVRNSEGKLSVKTEDGRIRLIGFTGDLDARTSDGLISLDGDFKKLSARSEEGIIVLTLPEDANVNIESNQRDIQTEGFSLAFLGDKQNASTWKIGNGGANYLLYTMAEGKIFIRKSQNLNSIQ